MFTGCSFLGSPDSLLCPISFSQSCGKTTTFLFFSHFRRLYWTNTSTSFLLPLHLTFSKNFSPRVPLFSHLFISFSLLVHLPLLDKTSTPREPLVPFSPMLICLLFFKFHLVPFLYSTCMRFAHGLFVANVHFINQKKKIAIILSCIFVGRTIFGTILLSAHSFFGAFLQTLLAQYFLCVFFLQKKKRRRRRKKERKKRKRKRLKMPIKEA
jgi:hypothetical protein